MGACIKNSHSQVVNDGEHFQDQSLKIQKKQSLRGNSSNRLPDVKRVKEANFKENIQNKMMDKLQMNTLHLETKYEMTTNSPSHVSHFTNHLTNKASLKTSSPQRNLNSTNRPSIKDTTSQMIDEDSPEKQTKINIKIKETIFEGASSQTGNMIGSSTFPITQKGANATLNREYSQKYKKIDGQNKNSYKQTSSKIIQENPEASSLIKINQNSSILKSTKIVSSNKQSQDALVSKGTMKKGNEESIKKTTSEIFDPSASNIEYSKQTIKPSDKKQSTKIIAQQGTIKESNGNRIKKTTISEIINSQSSNIQQVPIQQVEE